MATWEQVDDLIVSARVIQGLALICEIERCGVGRALELFNDRYEVLRRTRPADFTVPPGEYGRGVYT